MQVQSTPAPHPLFTHSLETEEYLCLKKDHFPLGSQTREEIEDTVNVMTAERKGPEYVCVPQRKVLIWIVVVLSLLLLTAVAALIGVRSGSCENTGTLDRNTKTHKIKTCQAYGCNKDWTLNGTKCYYFYPNKTKVSWDGARARCQDMDGDLVKIESREEQRFLFNRLVLENDWFWIGLTDAHTEGHWTWTDGSSLDPNLTFWKSEPDNWKGAGDIFPEGEDCVMMTAEQGNKVEESWRDIYCGSRENFMCEKLACR